MASEQRAPGSAGCALVTGASSGIGQAFAKRLARDGYSLILVARRADRLEAVARELAQSHAAPVSVLPADLSRPDDLGRVEDRLRKETRLELLVNNAGLGASGSFATLPLPREEQQIRVNVLALMRLSHAALAAMLPRARGALINVSSLAGFMPSPYSATHAACKAFVTSFSESLAEELRGTGVRVQALCPGFTRTEFHDEAGFDASALPALAWMSPAQVVDASLAGLRGGELVCVPGLANRLASYAMSAIPHRVLNRLIALVSKRLGDS